MSGRGRGRGRGRGPVSGARLLLQRSAKEAGLDDGNLRGLQDITRPSLFPDYEWHSNGLKGHDVVSVSPSVPDNIASSSSSSSVQPLMALAKPKRSAPAVYLINKSREIHHQFQNSAFYVQPTQEADVIRYGKEREREQRRPDLLVLKQMGKTADAEYIPPELLRDDDLESVYGGDDGNFKKRSLDDLAAEERADRRKRAVDNGVDDDGNLSDTLQDAIEEEEEEDADYGTNHYDSEVEEEGVGDGDEAVF